MRIGDVVTLALDRSVKVIQVEGFCERRGAAPAARTLYRDLTTSSGTKAYTFAGIPPKVSPGNGRQAGPRRAWPCVACGLTIVTIGSVAEFVPEP